MDKALQLAQEQLARTATELPVGAYPKSTRPDGKWKTIPATDMIGWTQGFFPGSLWQMYELTGDPAWRTRAEAWTHPLAVQRHDRQTHDLGFKLMTSFGHAYALTGDPRYKEVLLDAAASLAARYDRNVGAINCCDWNPEWHVPVVIDTMVNIELLYWAAENGGPPEFKDMALSHALVNLEDFVREDGGTIHVVDYAPGTGAILARRTYQGYADTSTWSRGHVWAMYGFTLSYRYTRDPRMLEAARKVTDYYLSRLPEDHVPNWDFDSPRQSKDSSAAAAAASAMLELQSLETDPLRKERYLRAAERTLESLTSPAYLATGTNSRGILLHAVGHLPANQEIDVSLIYGDYYFIEALLRYRALRETPTPEEPPVELTPPVASAPRDEGCTAAPGAIATVGGLLALLVLRRRRARR